MNTNIDIGTALSKRATVSIEAEESHEEHIARIKREDRSALFELIKAYIIFVGFVLLALVVVGVSVYEGFINLNASPETKRWSQTILSAVFTGFASFVLGQKTAKAK